MRVFISALVGRVPRGIAVGAGVCVAWLLLVWAWSRTQINPEFARAAAVGGVAFVVPVISLRKRTRIMRRDHGNAATFIALGTSPMLAVTNVLMRLPILASSVGYALWVVWIRRLGPHPSSRRVDRQSASATTAAGERDAVGVRNS